MNFAAEFTYKKGKIKYTGATVTKLSKGIGDCLAETITKLDEDNPEANLAAEAKSRLLHLRQKNAKAINRFGIEATMPAYLREEA